MDEATTNSEIADLARRIFNSHNDGRECFCPVCNGLSKIREKHQESVTEPVAESVGEVTAEMREWYISLDRFYSDQRQWVQCNGCTCTISGNFCDEEYNIWILEHYPHRAGEVRELLCQRCTLEYTVWSAPNALWNEVVQDGEHFLCFKCFIQLAQDRNILSPSIDDCRAHRCKKHWNVPPQNQTARNDSECGMCVAVPALTEGERNFPTFLPQGFENWSDEDKANYQQKRKVSLESFTVPTRTEVQLENDAIVTMNRAWEQSPAYDPENLSGLKLTFFEGYHAGQAAATPSPVDHKLQKIVHICAANSTLENGDTNFPMAEILDVIRGD